MMYRIVICFIFSTCFLYGQQNEEDIRFELERIILNDTEITLQETPGFLVTIVDGDDSYSIPFGTKLVDHDSLLSSDDIFEIGSVSKVMTASLVSVLAHEGHLDYDQNVNEVLPLSYQNPRLDDLTIMHLIQHTSSLPVRPHYFGRKNKNPDNPYEYYTAEDLLSFYANYIPNKEDWGQFRYAHTNYALLEIVLEAIMKTEYSTLLAKYIFDPLGMEHSFVHFGEEREGILTPGYDRAMKSSSPWIFKSFAASEGVKCATSDLAQFVRAHINPSSYKHEVLIQNTLPYIPTDFNEYIYTGKGWQVIERKKKYDIVTHTGKTGGHNVFIGFVKETKTGVIITANSSIGTENLGFLVLRMINHNWKRKSP